MGIHTWDGYFGYENKALKSYIETIERYCSECHTNDDYDGCEHCPTGIFIGQLRKYLVGISEIMENDKFRKAQDEETKIMIEIRKLVKKMPELHPLYLPVNEEYEFNSTFNQLKKLSFELNLQEECLHKEFEWKMHLAEIRRLGEGSRQVGNLQTNKISSKKSKKTKKRK